MFKLTGVLRSSNFFHMTFKANYKIFKVFFLLGFFFQIFQNISFNIFQSFLIFAVNEGKEERDLIIKKYALYYDLSFDLSFYYIYFLVFVIIIFCLLCLISLFNSQDILRILVIRGYSFSLIILFLFAYLLLGLISGYLLSVIGEIVFFIFLFDQISVERLLIDSFLAFFGSSVFFLITLASIVLFYSIVYVKPDIEPELRNTENFFSRISIIPKQRRQEESKFKLIFFLLLFSLFIKSITILKFSLLFTQEIISFLDDFNYFNDVLLIILFSTLFFLYSENILILINQRVLSQNKFMISKVFSKMTFKTMLNNLLFTLIIITAILIGTSQYNYHINVVEASYHFNHDVEFIPSSEYSNEEVTGILDTITFNFSYFSLIVLNIDIYSSNQNQSTSKTITLLNNIDDFNVMRPLSLYSNIQTQSWNEFVQNESGLIIYQSLAEELSLKQNDYLNIGFNLNGEKLWISAKIIGFYFGNMYPLMTHLILPFQFLNSTLQSEIDKYHYYEGWYYETENETISENIFRKYYFQLDNRNFKPLLENVLMTNFNPDSENYIYISVYSETFDPNFNNFFTQLTTRLNINFKTFYLLINLLLILLLFLFLLVINYRLYFIHNLKNTSLLMKYGYSKSQLTNIINKIQIFDFIVISLISIFVLLLYATYIYPASYFSTNITFPGLKRYYFTNSLLKNLSLFVFTFLGFLFIFRVFMVKFYSKRYIYLTS
ncbi:MAG: hypothetical protein HeimC3_34480 [Candidatus Heimdallarchaeota archaeon LC_3]|nr:MAG: hypothetical protein HeimC3_34480 [Candidatus Heimdallarchaeota archaeon LC_3]